MAYGTGGLPAWAQGKKVTIGSRLRNPNAAPLNDVFKALGYRYKDKAIRGAKTIPRRLRRAAIGGTVGGALGLAGAAVGIASGDPSAAFRNALAGGAAGYYGANYYGDRLAKEAVDASKTASAAFWGEEAKDRQQYLFDRDFKRNPENIDTLTKALGSRDKATKAMNDGSVQALLNNGITDPGKVAKALALRQKYIDRGMNDIDSLERAVSVAKWNRDSGMGVYEVNSHARETFIKGTAKQIMDNTGMSENAARRRVEDILKDMEYFET